MMEYWNIPLFQIYVVAGKYITIFDSYVTSEGVYIKIINKMLIITPLKRGYIVKRAYFYKNF